MKCDSVHVRMCESVDVWEWGCVKCDSACEDVWEWGCVKCDSVHVGMCGSGDV